MACSERYTNQPQELVPQPQVEEHITLSEELRPRPMREGDTLHRERIAKRKVVDSVALKRQDSIHQAQARIQRAESHPYPIHSTFESHSESPSYASEVLYRDVTPSEIFGETTTLVAPRMVVAPKPASLIENSAFEGLVLLLAVAYTLLLTRNMEDVKILFTRTLLDKSSTERLFAESSHGSYSRFIHLVCALGMVFMGVLVVKYGDTLLPDSVIRVIPQWIVMSMSIAVTALCGVIAAYQSVVIRLSGAVTISQGFTVQLLFLRRNYFALGTIIIAPILLLYALCPRDEGDGWSIAIIILVSLTVLCYIRDTFNLFIAQKISILHWFLYLCTVEIFPISFLVLLAVR